MTDGRERRIGVVLLVEDDPADQELIRRVLRGAPEPVRLFVVSSGHEAIDYLLRRQEFADPGASPRPDLILLDLNMPGMDGRDVLRRLKSEPELRRIPVVVLTTSTHRLDVCESYDLGCNSFVTKPDDLRRYASALHELGSYWLDLVTPAEKD